MEARKIGEWLYVEVIPPWFPCGEPIYPDPPRAREEGCSLHIIGAVKGGADGTPALKLPIRVEPGEYNFEDPELKALVEEDGVTVRIWYPQSEREEESWQKN